MVLGGGGGGGGRTSKGLRMNKTVCKSCLNMLYSQCHLFVNNFLPSDKKPLLRGSCYLAILI